MPEAPSLDSAIERLGGARSLLVALDFDGTLAPFADDPAAVAALPGSWAAALTLDRARDTHVVLVSGRPLAGLARVTHAPDGMSLVGSHGVEWRVDGHDEAALSPDELAAVDRIGVLLDAVAERHPGVHIEHKPAGLGVHTRRVGPAEARAAVEDARATVLAAFPDVHVRDGKDILEFAVRDVTKGDAVERLRALLDADRVLFAGDDVTDEDGFRALDQEAGDVGIKVGPGETRAAHRVADPAALTPVLQALARARAFR
ncbi:trehalose-phosphatase [Curtobacterium sp. MCBD17_013]|uniref:trehalose-phosphatase n=1 Tax=Curtobacterium sp. MCBD17_013 TaxID=2175668 RepID=UPI000DA88A6E|nr:trehalose-phosphatase [Curtobacterium sp. MCBD17_013]PZF64491.1 trehalose-phosphatase [Curtobacterium sp. MCBD17_013]